MDPATYGDREAAQAAWLSDTGEHPIARRKNFFIDAETMFANYHGRGSYSTWRDDVLHDYCEYGLSKNPEGEGWVLACPPSVEASIYMGDSGEYIFDQIPLVDVPVVVLRAKERDMSQAMIDFSTSATWPALASRFPNGTDVHLPDMTHFIPMQDPELTADYIVGDSRRSK